MDSGRSPEIQHAKKVKYGLFCHVAQFQNLIFHACQFHKGLIKTKWTSFQNARASDFKVDSRTWPNF